MEESGSWRDMLRWTYEGVDHTLKGNGGMECVNFIPTSQKIVETFVFILISSLEIYYASQRISLPKTVPDLEKRGDRTGRKVMLLIISLIFGIEIGFKCATKQMIWILNPCHMVTMTQMFLLVAPPSRLTMGVFRVSMHCLSGATIALIFPVVNTRLLPFETETYYIQHILMLVIPFYLMRLGGMYTPEPLLDFSWDVLALGILFFYHWTFMQPLAMISHVNLNNMICPAVSDPFYGRWYRTCACIHQSAAILLHGKAYTAVARCFLPARVVAVGKEYRLKEDGEAEERGTAATNGHAKMH